MGFKYGLENLVNAIATAQLNGKDIDLIIQDKKIELTKDEIIVKKEITSGDSIGGRPVKFEDEEIKESYITIKIGNKEFKKIDKDVVRITDGEHVVEPVLIDRPVLGN